MPNRLAFGAAIIAAIVAMAAPQRAAAEGNLVLYCAVQEEWCRNMVGAFERQSGIKVAMTRKSSGEFQHRIGRSRKVSVDSLQVAQHVKVAGSRRLV